MRKFIFAMVGLVAAGLASAGAADATIISGTYQLTQGLNNATIADLESNPFTLDLTVGVPQTVSLAIVVETPRSQAQVSMSAAFKFNQPTTAGGHSYTGLDTFCSGTCNGRANVDVDSLQWPSSITVDFSDGAILDITLLNASFNNAETLYRGLTQKARFTPEADPASVPEPGTLTVLGTGLVGLVRLRRNKRPGLKKVQAAA